MNLKNQISFLQTKQLAITLIFLSFTSFTFSQTMKEKMQAQKDKLAKKMEKDNSAAYECGHVHIPGLKEKANPMKMLQKGAGEGVTKGSNSDLGTAAISVVYQAHIHPQFIMKYPTKTPGWETCGDAVFAGFTNKSGAGLSSTDGSMTMNGEEIGYSGMGSYFLGFKPEKRGEKNMVITSSNGDKVDFDLKPGAPLEIKSIDGKAKGEEIIIDGTKDIVVELSEGGADPNSTLHVQIVCKLVGTPIMYDLFVTSARDRLVIPKEAFRNFEGSPTPYVKNNTLIVNRVTEKVIDGTDAGALRTLSAYMDWSPVTFAGDLAKGSALTMGFDKSKNVNIAFTTDTLAQYVFDVKKQGPFYAPPTTDIKKVAVASFIIRGNLEATEVTTGNGWKTTTTKWFPKLEEGTWQNLVDQMYKDFESKVNSQLGYEFLPMDKVTESQAYAHSKPIVDGQTGNYVEVGAQGTKRIVSTRWNDIWKDASISFGSDFISERLIQELGADAVFSVVIDLDFNIQTNTLDPKVNIVAFSPNVSYKQMGKYFTMDAKSIPVDFESAKDASLSTHDLIYKMVNAETLTETIIDAIKQLQTKESELAVYKALWDAKN